MFSTAAAIGVGCFLILWAGGQYLANVGPEWIAQLLWLLAVVGGSAACGYLAPDRAWRWGAVVAFIQPVAAFVILRFVPSPADTSSSTGGMVAVAIFTVLAVMASPLAILASHGAARARAKQPTAS